MTNKDAGTTSTVRDKGDRNAAYGIAGIVAVIAFLLWLGNLALAVYGDWGTTSSDGYANRGTFGDVFGVVNSVFSGFAFIGVVFSLIMQREQTRQSDEMLRHSREEMRITLEDMKQTRVILDKQEQNIEQQRQATYKQSFESTFFQLFNSFNQITNALEMEVVSNEHDPQKKSSWTRRGRDVFESLLARLTELRNRNEAQAQSSPDLKLISGERGYLFEAWIRLAAEHGDDIGRYYRSFYLLMSFIDDAAITDAEKRMYAKIVRSQLSRSESTLLALNFFSGECSDEFRSVVTKYGMLKNANRGNRLINLLASEIPAEAFGRGHVRSRETLETLRSFGQEQP